MQKKSNRFLISLLRLFRWQNLLIIVATQYLTAFCLIESMTPKRLFADLNMVFLSLGTVIIAAAGYMINDYYDVKIDYVNRPDRVLVGRFLRRRHVLAWHTVLNFSGIMAGLLISWEISLTNLLAAGLLWLYSNQLKRLPLVGNFSISLLTGLAVFVVFIYLKESIFLISAYAFFAFFISLIREIIKDMEDIAGDKKFNCRTLPIVIGQRNTKLVIYLISVLFIVVVAVLLQEEPKFWYVLGGLTLMLSLLNFLLARADKSIDFARLSSLSKQIMVLGLISMIFLK